MTPIVRVERLPHFGANGGSNGLVGQRLSETFSPRLFADRKRDMERQLDAHLTKLDRLGSLEDEDAGRQSR